MTNCSTQLLQINGVDLCVETLGDAAHPAILLIAGAACSMDWWEDEFCERLVAGARFVIRYDARDTGRSVSYPAGAPTYTVRDLCADALGVLDALGLDRAHVVGMSLGGGVAQFLAIEHPSRVSSLTVISTSPGGPGDNADLPPMEERMRAIFAAPAPEPDWSDRTAVIEYLVQGIPLFAGSCTIAEEILRRLVARVVDRTANIASTMTNHWILPAGGDSLRPRLGTVTAPTLVMHGTEDPLLPYGHGEALANAISGTVLIPLQGVGHEVPPRQVWDVVVPAILLHTRDAARLLSRELANRSGEIPIVRTE